MGTTIQILISLERDTDNTNPTAKLRLQPSFDGDLVYIAITDSDREIVVRADDLFSAMKAIEAQS